MNQIQETIKTLQSFRFNVSTEAELKIEMQQAMEKSSLGFIPEFSLDAKNRPDFYKDGIVIEVKIKGSSKSIYRQCERYCGFNEVKALILVTNKSMGFPKEINEKPCYVVNLGKAWL